MNSGIETGPCLLHEVGDGNAVWAFQSRHAEITAGIGTVSSAQRQVLFCRSGTLWAGRGGRLECVDKQPAFRIENDVIALDESGTAFRDLQGELDECCNRVSK